MVFFLLRNVTVDTPVIFENLLCEIRSPISIDARYNDAAACPIGFFPAEEPHFSISDNIFKAKRLVFSQMPNFSFNPFRKVKDFTRILSEDFLFCFCHPIILAD